MKRIWLDLELREDIDDYVTLLYALESKADLIAVSINNPSVNELCLLNYTLNRYAVDIPVFISGEITTYPKEKDIKEILFFKDDYFCLPEFCNLFDNEDKVPTEPFIVFCGGSLTTLSLLTSVNPNIEACVQGGFASFKIVPEAAVLKKFRKREKVPTWNLNLDLKATEAVLDSSIKIHFVSKNICHSAFVSEKDLADKDSFLYTVIGDYFASTPFKDKCMHDLLAYMSVIDNSLVDFEPVGMCKTTDERPKWWAEKDEGSKHFISVNYDYERFISLFRNPLLKQTLKEKKVHGRKRIKR